jgi:hypothetical protein
VAYDVCPTTRRASSDHEKHAMYRSCYFLTFFRFVTMQEAGLALGSDFRSMGDNGSGCVNAATTGTAFLNHLLLFLLLLLLLTSLAAAAATSAA